MLHNSIPSTPTPPSNRLRQTESEGREPAPGGSVAEARVAMRMGCIDQAEAILGAMADRRARDAAWLNLMGVVCESRGDWRRARRFYGRAMRADRHFRPAEQNMRRWFELVTFGRTDCPLSLGD